MTQKHLKPRKKSGLGKTQNVASAAVRIMALSQRGRISKPQQNKKKKTTGKKRRDSSILFPGFQNPGNYSRPKTNKRKNKKIHGEQQTAMRLSAIMLSEVCIIDKQEREFRRSDHTPSSDSETSKLSNLAPFILDSIGTCAQTKKKKE
jgi:hypothetical protein